MSYTITNASWGIAVVLILIGVVRLPGVRERFGKKKEEPAAAAAT